MAARKRDTLSRHAKKMQREQTVEGAGTRKTAPPAKKAPAPAAILLPRPKRKGGVPVTETRKASTKVAPTAAQKAAAKRKANPRRYQAHGSR